MRTTAVVFHFAALLEGIGGLKSRMDDMHRLMMVLIGIAGGGLVTALGSLVLQLLK